MSQTMLGRPQLPLQVSTAGIIPIARGIAADVLVDVVEILAEEGLPVLEITVPTESDLSGLQAVAAAAGDDVMIGAGTVLSLAQAQRAVDCGARFLIMPDMDPSIIGWAARAGIPCLPGVFTPTEALRAWRLGASAVKLFPACALSPRFLSELSGPMPEIPVVPTGGVTLESIGSWIGAGAAAVGMGKSLLGDGSPDSLRERIRRARAAVEAGRST